MTNITGFTFLSTDGKTQLHGMRWEPEGRSVRAVCNGKRCCGGSDPARQPDIARFGRDRKDRLQPVR